MDEKKSFTKINKTERHNGNNKCRCGSIKHLQITLRDLPKGIDFWKAKKLALGIRLY